MSMTEKEYRQLPYSEYFSASFIKMFDKEGPKCLIEKIVYDNKELLKGSIIDSLAFDKNNFENIYYVSSSIKEPTVTEKTLLDSFKATIELKDIESPLYIKEGLNLIKNLKLWKNIKKEDILIEKLNNPEFKKHLKDLFLSEGKIVISGNDYMNSLDTVKNLKNNKFTKEYFESKDIKKKQALFQIPIIFNIQDDKFKCLLDILLIDHTNKQIRAVDLKTGFDTNSSFKYSILKWRYDIQAALYTKALENYIIENDLKDYSIENPIFIYTQVSQPDRPLCFEFNHQVVKAAFRGFKLSNGYKYKGIFELVEEINWHRENEIYNYSKEEYENNGKVDLTLSSMNIDDYTNDMPNNFFNNYNRQEPLPFYTGTEGGISASQRIILERELRGLRNGTFGLGRTVDPNEIPRPERVVIRDEVRDNNEEQGW